MSERRRRFISAPPAELWSPSVGLWECPACGKLYARAGQGHSCIVVPLEHLFRERARGRELFEAFRARQKNPTDAQSAPVIWALDR
jgi:hypothetical protein